MDLKVLKNAMEQLEEEKGVSKEAVLEAIETSLAAAYKKEYGKRGQIIRAQFNLETGETDFAQVKGVVDETTVREEDDEEDEDAPEGIGSKDEPTNEDDEEKDERVRYNPEHHIYLTDAKKIKGDAVLDDEIVFELETRDDFGRIAAQTAKQVIIQKIREAERSSVLAEFGEREGEIVSGNVERVDRGAIFVDLGKATGIVSYEDQIPRERYRQGERIRAYLYAVEETPRGVSLKLSRSKPEFVRELFRLEAPEIASGTVEIHGIAREAGSRLKMAVASSDDHIDPVGACVGQRGVRVTTVMSELGGEKIDIIEWSDDPAQFIADALSPAKAESVEIDEEEHTAVVVVDRAELSLAIGRSGQNARLAAKLSGWKIDVQSKGGEVEEAYDPEGGKEVIAEDDASEGGEAKTATPQAEDEVEKEEEKPAPETDEGISDEETNKEEDNTEQKDAEDTEKNETEDETTDEGVQSEGEDKEPSKKDTTEDSGENDEEKSEDEGEAKA